MFESDLQSPELLKQRYTVHIDRIIYCVVVAVGMIDKNRNSSYGVQH